MITLAALPVVVLALHFISFFFCTSLFTSRLLLLRLHLVLLLHLPPVTLHFAVIWRIPLLLEATLSL